jgi:porin
MNNRRRWVALVMMAVIGPGVRSANAEPADNTPPGLGYTQAFDVPPVDRLFGDWGGLQPTLQADGINVQLDALTEFAGNVSGGLKQGATFTSQVGFETDVNWERLAGITGLSTHVIIVQRSGSSDSALFGDYFSPVQEVYGSGGDVLLHLVSAYAQETLYDGKFDIALGRMNVENDFASSGLYCNFMNNGLCGDPKALPGGDIGHSAYPDAAWGARIKLLPLPDISVTTGIYQVNQGTYSYANFRTGFKFDDSQTSGVYLPVELAWNPSFGPDKLLGHYKFGFGYDDSSHYADFDNGLATDGVPGYTDHYRTGNTQVWALFDQMLLRTGKGDNQGLIALAGFVHNDPNNSVYAEQYYGGLLYRGFWAARPKDTMGLLFLRENVSAKLGNVQALEAALDLGYSNSATGVQSNQDIVEADYTIQVYHGVTFMPDFQYVIKPNAQANIRDAAVFGFRLHGEF